MKVEWTGKTGRIVRVGDAVRRELQWMEIAMFGCWLLHLDGNREVWDLKLCREDDIWSLVKKEDENVVR